MTPLHLSHNHFELFGLPARFAVDLRQLDLGYRDMQSRVHPDRFANASESERRVSMQWATRVNEAYQTLRVPLRRAGYLLELAGIDPGVESKTAMPADFLAEQMEWREALEEAQAQRDAGELGSLGRRLGVELANLYAAIGRQLDRQDHADAVATLRKLMFLEKLRSAIEEALEMIEEQRA